jgi:hypothetical protein
MPRAKKNPDPAATGSAGNGADATNGASETTNRTRERGRAGSGTRTRRAPAAPTVETVVAVGVESEGVQVGVGPQPGLVAAGLQTTALQEQLAAVQEQVTEIIRQAQEARSSVKSLRDEREQIGRELGELRQQVRAAQEQSLRETREGYGKVGHELTTTAGRLGETVRHAQQEISEVVRQAREARHELEELRRHVQEGRPEGGAPTADTGREQPKRRERRASGRGESKAAAAEHRNRLGVTVGNGVVVAEVLPDSPAADAGLTRGDVIEEVNGTGVVTAAQLRDAVRKADDGEEVALQVFRAGELHELRAKLAAEAEGDKKADAEGRNRLGVTAGLGVVVAEVLPDTPAAAAGLARGDVIDDLNGKPVQTGEQLRDLVQHLPAGDEVVLRVTRVGEVREVRTRLDGSAAS